MSATKSSVKADLIRYAHSLGFERVGVTSADDHVEAGARLDDWLAEGREGSMTYMSAAPSRRSSPRALLPEARSVIALAMTYAAPEEPQSSETRPSARVSRYTAGGDYHKSIKKKLQAFTRYLESIAPGVKTCAMVDTGPLLERAFAQKAGLGFVGKNTMLITRGLGSWVFLASVITSLELPADAPDDRTCGECRICIDACPTEAITAPFQLDARRCIAYLTIENRESIPEEFRKPSGPWAFGCDVCQEVCPHNSGRTSPARTINLHEVLGLKTDEEFTARFAGTAMTRSGRRGLIRNACQAAANLGRTDLAAQLKTLTADPDAMIRESAVWAMKQLKVT